MDIAKPDVFGAGNLDRVRERLVTANHAIDVEIGDGDIAGIANLERQGKAAFSSLLFRLQGINLPVGSVAKNHFVADVVLAGKFVDSAAGGSVRNVEAGLGKSAGRPDVDECAATAVGDPEAWILGVPAAVDVGIGGVRVVVNLLPNFGGG